MRRLDVLGEGTADEAVARAWAETRARADAVVASTGDWPCRRGCDACCRTLGEVPYATATEWERVRAAIGALAADVRDAIHVRVGELAAARAPYTCPMLDRATGACTIYAARPTACRAYGFYVDADGDARACERIDREAPVVWGNEAALDRALTRGAGPLIGMLDPEAGLSCRP